MAGPLRRTELAQRFRFDLADTLAGDVELLPDLFESVLSLTADAEAKPDDLLFLGRKCFQDVCRLIADVGVDYRIDRGADPAILNKIAKSGLAIAADGGFE